ncbi:MAG TPA: Stf0 family sulfotransferase [Verrucomicrobiae bacterium]|nr:Stf0 family sulfotransferase [Verrucomicrobiae bacterium]
MHAPVIIMIAVESKPSALYRPRLSLAICTNPRSGSWLLSEALASTGLAGNPREWFNALEKHDQQAAWRARHGSDLADDAYLDYALRSGTSANGVFGVKLHYYQLRELCNASAKFMSATFPNLRYVWLTRRDKERQAISYHRAHATNRWWSIPNEIAASEAEPPFDPAAALQLERILIEHDRGWERYFSENGIEPLVVTYESLANDYAGTVRTVLRWLGVGRRRRLHIAVPRLRQQADAQTDRWLEEYRGWKSRLPRSDAWKQWIARNVTSGVPNETIVGVMAANGFSQADAATELRAELRRQLDKALAFASIPRPPRDDVPHVQALAPQEFFDSYYAQNRPVVIDGLMARWPAPGRWTPAYLKSVLGEEQVEIMAGRDADPDYEINANAHRRMMPFAKLVDAVFDGPDGNDRYLVANNGFFRRDRARALLRDVEPLPEYLDPAALEEQCHLWFGPGGTVTPLHHDKCNLLVAQVLGSKHFKLIAPEQWPHLYNEVGVFSRVDPEHPDFERWPEFRHARILDVVLQPGQTLFLPVGWFHHVRALAPSMMLSFSNFRVPNAYRWPSD